MPLSARLPLPDPFDFHLTVSHQTYFRGRAGADLYEDGTYYRALRRGAGVVVASAKAVDDGLEVRIDGDSEEDLRFACGSMAWLLALDADLAGFYAMLGDDAALSDAVGRLRGLRPPRAESVFEALVIAILGQQISANVARVIREGLVSTYGVPIESGGRLLHAFPSPESLLAAGPDALRAHKLSVRKVEYVQDAARRAIDGELDIARFQTMADEEVIAELTKVRGIGRWTAEWVLLRALGRADVFPAGDLALRRVVSELYFDSAPITEPELAAFGKRWMPYRGLATTYLFSFLRQRRVAQGVVPPTQPG